MRRKILILFLLFSASLSPVFATHERAGDITFTNTSGNKYLISITTYTRTSSPADRPTLDSVYFGDGTQGVFTRMSKDSVAPDISRNFYQEYHTYPGSGAYTIHFEDPNRNADVVNIPNSVNVPFYVESVLVISPYTASDHSPILTQPPIDFGCTNRLFVYNPGAYDADGDSLSYNLVVCKGANGVDITGYTFPSSYVTGGGTFTLNASTGDMIWQDPNTTGAFNVAFEVHEWRRVNGFPIDIGYVKRDMQIYIGNCQNLPPVIEPVPPVCVLAGDHATFSVCAYDPDGEHVALSAFGSTFTFSPDVSQFSQNVSNSDTACGTYNWATSCARVRTQPYNVIIKASDITSPGDTALVDLQQVSIRVVGPPPLNPVATPSGNSIIVTWQPSACAAYIGGYKVYRRNGTYTGAIPCPCDNGVPDYTGYQFLAYVNGVNNNLFVDNGNGTGLAHGVDYCYLITAIYKTEDSTQSCASVQACAFLIKDLPVITNASVITTDAAAGADTVAWSKPTQFDTTKLKPPFQYRVYHSGDFFGKNFSLIATLPDINDTIIVDSLINTVANPYSYKVEFYSDSSGTPLLAGSTQTASSIYLKTSPTDHEMDLSWEEHVPWTNDSFLVYRKDPDSVNFYVIGTTTLHTYADTGLVNDSSYCYYVQSFGQYSAPGYVNPIINLSQQVCSIPLDNVPPCKPLLVVIADCENERNELTWNNPNHSCAHDVAGYTIWYYTPVQTDPDSLTTLYNPNDTTYIHSNISSNTGCYSVVAFDSAGNRSAQVPFVCVDSCHQYYLPNVFSPDNDGINDLFHPCDQTTAAELQKKCPPYKNVKDVNMKIYNRWGNLVFETTDKDINWDGKNKDSGKDCSDGVYYYICEVHEIYLEGLKSHTITGFVEIFRKH